MISDIIHECFSTKQAVQLAPPLPGWNVRKVYTAEEKAIGRILAAYPRVCLLYGEDAFDNSIPGTWVQVGPQFWEVPVNVDLGSLVKWLYIGNWFLIATGASTIANEDWDDLASFDAERGVAALKRVGAQMSIYSFFDDTEWFVVGADEGTRPMD